MLNVIKTPEDLWREIFKISQDSRVVNSELFGENDEHLLLAYGPVAQRNQFQSLLYSSANKFNVSILPIHDFELFSNIPWPGKVVCHFHWIHGKTAVAKNKKEADEAVRFWEKLLCQIKKKKYKIVWTVHNVMPHESFWVEQDKIIHQMMADAADYLHIMANDSVKLTESYYELNKNKLFYLPHPSYEGAQPSDVAREFARRTLSIESDEFVFLSFGAIMRYKGYERLMNAYDKVLEKTDKKIKLIIAGLPTEKSLVETIHKWGRGRENVILDLTPIPNDKLQIYFKSADIAVCPYYRTMNSGAAMMATTFGVPVLGPNSGGFMDIEKEGGGITFDNSDDNSLIEKMIFSMSMKFEKIDAFRSKVNPQKISSKFFEKLYKL